MPQPPQLFAATVAHGSQLSQASLQPIRLLNRRFSQPPLRDELQSLANQGVVGELGTVFLRADGTSSSIALNDRASGLPIDALRLIPRRICVGVGRTKAAILRAALVAGAVTDLVVDDSAAERLAEDSDFVIG